MVNPATLKLDDALLDYLGDVFLNTEGRDYGSFEEFVDRYLFGLSHE